MKFFRARRPELEQRVDTLEQAMIDLEGHTHFLDGQRIRTVRQLAAMQSLLESLIRAHPRPDMMLRWWNHEIPMLIDEVSEVSPELPIEHQMEAMAWQGMVKRYTKLIEEAAAFYAQCGGDDG
ncbi:hypothetical protein [Xanthomonas albilineans]|uniref:hypothetical protein n=1 Tax=Xanthomonas albilineans TaxID=29447 RepID=UPI0005F30AAC|nr:hypothetical protein [Xanthomonas albilineans]